MQQESGDAGGVVSGGRLEGLSWELNKQWNFMSGKGLCIE